jgi:hypothetical protein
MTNPKLIDTTKPSTVAGWLGIALLIVVLAWMQQRDSEPESPKCPPPGYGQQLIGRGHMEIDGEAGELQCTYSTAPVYGHMVAKK